MLADEIRSYCGSAEACKALSYLAHYGMPRRSGRYPWGSGEDPYQSGEDFLGRVERLRKEKFTYTDDKGKTWAGDLAIAKSMGMSSTQFRTEIGLARDERRIRNLHKMRSLKADNPGISRSEIARRMGVNESYLRSLETSRDEGRTSAARSTADFLKQRLKDVGEGKMLDVGKAVEKDLNVSEQTFKKALTILEHEGYPVYGGRIPQINNPGKDTTLKVLCPPGTKHREIFELDRIESVGDYVTKDNGETFRTYQYPSSLSSKRIKVRYSEEGGLEKDGLVEIRRGVKDLSLGNNDYAQVRILVDGTHYIKGMAVYSDDLPDGVDIMFNTNKTKGTPMMGPKNDTVLKPIKKDDPDNPFGTLIEAKGQSMYTDDDGKEQLSPINMARRTGDWSDWTNAVPSQFLAKQPKALIERQLKQTMEEKTAEFNAINDLTNPTLKKMLMKKFADECDSTAVSLKAAPLPGQKYHVIIPVNSLTDNECYAPDYPNGTQLALIRYPHAGTFEIPIVTVNNRNPEAAKLLGKTGGDVIGINKNNADRLSGADFDGDTVMAIPTNQPGGKIQIASAPKLKGLEGFNPSEAYPERPGMRRMTKQMTQQQMGIVSNLIMDMTLKGASDEEMAAAVRHSMVVIDAEKHNLDFKQSEIDNNILALKARYQEQSEDKFGGASTLLTRAKSTEWVDKRQGTPKINIKGTPDYDPSKPEGALIYKTATDLTYSYDVTDTRTGQTKTITKSRKEPSTKMAETQDARDLISSYRATPELLYADYANFMKDLANKARLVSATTKGNPVDKEAKSEYESEVASLKSQLNSSLANKPRERLAQIRANSEISALKKQAAEEGRVLEKGDIRKAGQRALSKARSKLGSVSRKERNINITDREWEAIQKGALSESVLYQIFENTDLDKLRERAMPRVTTTLSQSQVSRIQALVNSGYTLSEIADALGCSTSTVYKYTSGKGG